MTIDSRNSEQRMERLRRRFLVLAVAENVLRAAAIACFAWGALTIALRGSLRTELAALWPWGAAALAAAVVAGAVRGQRACPDAASVAALVDRHERSGGLLMAGREVDLGEWSERLDQGAARAPRLSWRAGPASTLAAGGLAFALLAAFVPVGDVEATAGALALADEIAEIEERVAVLVEEELLDPELAEDLAADLDALRGDTGEDPANAWEALDHLRELTEETAAAAAEQAAAEDERLAAAEAVAEALADGNAESPAAAAEAAAELAALTARAADESRLLDAAATEALRNAAGGELRQLQEALKQGRGNLAETLRRLQEAGLLDSEKLRQMLQELRQEDLARFLEENGLPKAGAMCRLGTWGDGEEDGQRLGQGGVGRGRADAPMTWRPPVSADGAAFQEERLDPAALAGLERSHVVGLSAAAPTAGPGAGVGEAATAIRPGAGGAHTQPLLPRHRGAVRRFFERRPTADEDP